MGNGDRCALSAARCAASRAAAAPGDARRMLPCWKRRNTLGSQAPRGRASTSPVYEGSSGGQGSPPAPPHCRVLNGQSLGPAQVPPLWRGLGAAWAPVRSSCTVLLAAACVTRSPAPETGPYFSGDGQDLWSFLLMPKQTLGQFFREAE